MRTEAAISVGALINAEEIRPLKYVQMPFPMIFGIYRGWGDGREEEVMKDPA